MTAPKISCILPTFNRAGMLPLAIESVLAQTEPSFELIVVDDCSTDDTPKVVAEYAVREPRIRSLRNAANSKLPQSLNNGFAVARGKYLNWTSDDNLFEPNAFARMSAALDADAEIGLVYSDYRLIDAAGGVTAALRQPEPERIAVCNLMICFLYRREVHERLGGYRPDRFLYEDWDFLLRASLHFRLAHLHEFLYLYRQHEGSLSATREAEAIRGSCDLMEDALPRLAWLPPAALAAGFLYQAERCHRMGRHGAALRNALAGFRRSPASAWRAFKELAHGRYRGWKKHRRSKPA